jgi:hypothetical protein
LSEGRECCRFKASKGEAVVLLSPTLGNAEDAVSSAFPQGKRDGIKNGYLSSTEIRVINLHGYLHVSLDPNLVIYFENSPSFGYYQA